MKTMISRAIMPRRRLSAAMKAKVGEKLRMTPNHNAHIITHHGNLMLGRKGRN